MATFAVGMIVVGIVTTSFLQLQLHAISASDHHTDFAKAFTIDKILELELVTIPSSTLAIRCTTIAASTEMNLWL